MNFLALGCFIVWLYLLSVFKRGELRFWYFLFGSVGFFVFALIWIEPLVVKPLIKVVSAVAGILGQLTGMYESYFDYGMLFINSGTSNISLYIDYECSGIIEILAFSAMLWFFPIYRLYEKTVLTVFGIFYIFLANILRIFVISVLIRQYGNDIYYLAHTVFGRVVFYTLSVLLYFYVFTHPHIIRQKVGKFKYGTD